MAVTKKTILRQGQHLNIFKSWFRFTRPANDTPYSAGDAVADKTSAATVLSFEGLVPKVGGSIRIDEVMVTSGNVALTASFKLWLFSKSPTAINDNAAFTLTDAENEDAEGVILVDNQSSATNAWRAESSLIGKTFTLASHDKNLYGLLEIRGSYTPASAEAIKVIIKGVVL